MSHIDWNDFYSKFEEKFRGSSEIIKKRLKFYIPFLLALRKFDQKKLLKALDIGCGRGEFLEILKKSGFFPIGIEINKKFVEDLKKRGYEVYKVDALEFLKNLKNNTFAVVSMIHVIEHLEFKYTLELIFEIHRILEPGGILIIETPNTQNLYVGSYSFWIDPTHKKPIHPELIKFIGEYTGFLRTQIYYPLINYKEKISFNDIIFGVSPDVSVILQKDGPPELIKNFDYLFKNPPQFTIQDIISKFDQKIKNEFFYLNKKIEDKFLIIENEIKNNIAFIEANLSALINSKAWRFYQNLSKTKKFILMNFKNLKEFPFTFLKFIYFFLKKHPSIYFKIKLLIDKIPGMKKYLKRLIFKDHPSFTLSSYKDALSYKEEIIYKKLKSYINKD